MSRFTSIIGFNLPKAPWKWNLSTPSLEDVCSVWILMIGLYSSLHVFWCTANLVYAFHHLETVEKAMIGVVEGAVSYFLLGIVQEFPAFKRWVTIHYMWVCTVGAVIDCATELVLLWPDERLWGVSGAMASFLLNTLSAILVFRLWKVQLIIRKTTILSGPRLAQFDIATEKVGAFAIALGSLAFVILQPPIMVTIIGGAVTQAAAYYLTAYRFVLTDRYVKQHGLVYVYKKL